MKRILAFLLCMVMVFALCACGNDEATPTEKSPTNPVTAPSTPTENNNATEPTQDNPDSTTPDEEVSDDTIRENGKLPNDPSKLTSAEEKHYLGEVIQAIIDLDVETLEDLADSNSVNCIRYIRDNENYRKAWNKTVGQSIYLEDSKYIAHRDPQYIFANWITSVYNKNETLKGFIYNYSEEELLQILDTYGSNAPYVISEIDDYFIDVVDGKISISCNQVLQDAGWDTLSDMGFYGWAGKENEQLARIIFGAGCGIANGLDEINKNGFTIWQDMLTGNVNKIVAAFDKATGYDLNEPITSKLGQFNARYYQAYYKNVDNAAKIQDWMNENVQILRDTSNILVYMRIRTIDDALYYITEEERAEIQHLELYCAMIVWGFQANTEAEFIPFYEIAEEMLHLKKLERQH